MMTDLGSTSSDSSSFPGLGRGRPGLLARDRYLRERLGDVFVQAVLRGDLVPMVSSSARVSFFRSLHACPLDKECRDLGAPSRLIFRTRRWMVTVALTPGSRMVGPRPGGHDLLGFISLDVPISEVCHNVVHLETLTDEGGLLLQGVRSCPLRRGHEGGCLDWSRGVRVSRCVVSSTE